MSSTLPRILLQIQYEEAAEAYLRSLPPEHFMEAAAQSMQREIITESLALVKADRPEVQYFNELLVQYRIGRAQKLRQVVPDTMVIVHTEPIKVDGSYNLPLQRIRPFWMLEYVSKYNKRKDYDDNFRKYERELKVPYYLLFFPDTMDLTLYRLRNTRYAAVRPNSAGRLPIKRLELEMAIHDEWVRVWFRGELLPLPADQMREVRQLREQARQAQEAANRKDQAMERMRAQMRAMGIEPQE
jgi:Uma2 family endonuclease